MRILVVEDEQRLAALLRRVLTEERHTVEIALDGESGFDLAASNTHDLIILDLMLPRMNGLDICRALREQSLWMPILMLTARGAVEDRVAGLTAGADDYLVKPFAMEEFLARVRALIRRRQGTNDGATVLHVGELTLDLLRHEAKRNTSIIELTAKEYALLEFLMRHPGQALTRTQIMDHVWQYDFDALSNVVDIYIHYLRDKVDRRFPRQLIKTIRGVGYRIDP